jgi:hypothetical protein
MQEDLLEGDIALGPALPERRERALAPQHAVVEDSDPVAQLLRDLHRVGRE